MGSTSERARKETIESNILILQLQRTEIKDARQKVLKDLERINGMKVTRAKVPDYVDHIGMIRINKQRKLREKLKKTMTNDFGNLMTSQCTSKGMYHAVTLPNSKVSYDGDDSIHEFGSVA